MAAHDEQTHVEKKHAATEAMESGLADKQTSGDSYGSAETGRYFTAASTRSPNDSRSVTPEPTSSETTVSVTSATEDNSRFDPRNTDLDYFHREARFDQQISAGEFTKVKGLSDCCRFDGKVELHSWRKDSHCETVVVKRVVSSRVGANVGKEVNERVVYRGHCQRHAEDCLNEIGVYCYLAKQADLPQYLLKMHTAFQASPDVWLVLEHANDGDLFAVASKLKREGSSLSACQLMTWTWQLLQAVHYLHRHAIGHRDISMENVLLSNGNVRLMDFGQSVRTHSSGGALLRYFNALGKPYYRPPECHSPMQNSVDVHVPPGAQPGEVAFVRTVAGDTLCEVLLPSTATPGQISPAEPWGYAAAPVDIFACGVCIFIMATGMPPWRQANLSDPHFAWVHQCSISQLLKAWKKTMPPAADELMAAMVKSEPAKRPSAEQCLSHRWFNELCGAEVPVHPMSCSQSSTASGAADTQSTSSSLEFGAIAGDPYREEGVVRSVVAPAARMPSPVAAFAGTILAGDFYSMPEDTTCRSADPVLEELTLQRFPANSRPPTVPATDSFSLEPTTFCVTGKEPCVLGEHLLDFLTMAAGAVIKKTNSTKMTIKAQVDSEDGACTLKVRVYNQGGNKYAVEFQRRDGDTTAFHKVFEQAFEQFADPAKSGSEGNNGTIGTDTEKVAAPIGSGKEKTQIPIPSRQADLNSTWPPSRSRPTRGGRPAGRLVTERRSAPASPTRANTAATGDAKIATADAIEAISSELASAAGSGLNAVRLRSKSTVRRPPNVHSTTPLEPYAAT